MKKRPAKISIENRCYGCYQTLEEGIYHAKCSRILFGTSVPPLLDTTAHEVNRLANELVRVKLAIPGVQPKLSLKVEGKEVKRLTVIGSLGGSYIMKPQSPDYPELPENEDLCMRLARICGIPTAVHGLLPTAEGQLAYVTRRFDRHKNKKIAVEDLCQLSNLMTEQKYRASHESLGKVIRSFSSVPGEDILKFFELVLFSFIIGNNDMHLKNFSMLTEDPTHVVLSPAYDLLSVRLVVPEKDDHEDLALTLNGKKSKIHHMDFKKFAETLLIPEKVFSRVFLRFTEKKNEMFKLVEQSFLSEDSKTRLKAIIDSRFKRLDAKETWKVSV